MMKLPNFPDPEATGAELHIAGVLLHAHPDSLGPVRDALSDMADVEVFQASPDGRVVLVLEANSSAAVVAQLESMRNLDGVFGVSLVYQHAESVEALQEELDP